MNRPLHIAYLYSRYPVASQTFCDSEMLALERMGDRITVVSLNPPKDAFRHERLNALQARCIYPPPNKVLSVATREGHNDRYREPLEALAREHEARYGPDFKSRIRARNAAYFAGKLEAMGIDHIHVHFANRATHTALMLKQCGFHFSFTAHAQDFMVDLGSDELLREMAREAEFVLAVSDFSRDLLAGRCPKSAGKIFRVYNGIQPSEFPNALAKNEETALFRVISIGRLIEFKGFHFLIEAVSKLNEDGRKTELTIVGDGPWKERLEKLASKLGIAERVEFAGRLSQERIKERLAESDVFALACNVDSKGASDILPTVIMEAMACGLPIVSTRVAGVPEMVENEKNGLVVEAGNSCELARALREIAEGPARAKRMGEAGIALVKERFNLELTARQVRNYLARVIQSPARKPPEPRALYLVGSWPLPESLLFHELRFFARRPEIRVLVCDLRSDFRMSSETDDSILCADFLPAAAVIDGIYEQESELRARAIELAGKLPPGVETTGLLKKAVYLAWELGKTKVHHVHVSRSDTVVLGWLVSKLTGLQSSYAIEPKAKAELSGELRNQLCPDFDFGCGPGEGSDSLLLARGDIKKRYRLGPVKWSRKRKDLAALGGAYEDWAQKLISTKQNDQGEPVKP